MNTVENREFPFLEIVPAADPRFEQSARCDLTNATLFDERSAAEKSETSYWIRVGLAQDLCLVCPVRKACLQFGIENRLSGVMGGEMLNLGRVIRPQPRRTLVSA